MRPGYVPGTQKYEDIEGSQDEPTLSQVIANNPDSYPYEMDSEGYYLAQQYYLGWFYGTEVYNRYEDYDYTSYIAWELYEMSNNGTDISQVTISEVDEIYLGLYEKHAGRRQTVNSLIFLGTMAYLSYNMAPPSTMNNPFDDIFSNPERIVPDLPRGEYYYLRGQDLLRVSDTGDFISLYPGANTTRVIDAINAMK